MTRQRRVTDPPTRGWRPSDAELGWIIENRVDEAYILSWPGPLEIYVPVHDTGGYDRARAPMGSYDFRLDQIKGTASLHSGNQVHLSFETPALHPRANIDFTLVYFARSTRGPADPAWKVPSLDLDRVCTPVPGHRARWVFSASRSGVARDRASKYQIAMSDLAGSHGWSVLPPKASLPTVSAQPLEASAFFKRAFDAPPGGDRRRGPDGRPARRVRPSPGRLLEVDPCLGVHRHPRRHSHPFQGLDPGEHSR